MIERTDRANWSTIKHLLTSPKHYRHALLNPREDTEALLRGRLTHCMVYEPAQTSARYVRAPNFHRGMKDDTARDKGYDGGKDAALAFDAANAGREIITPAMWDDALGMAASLHADPHAGPMIRGGYAEQLVTWTDAATGIECRGRVDHLNGRLSDLKTARFVEPRAFARQAASLLYHGQIAYYADGLAANGIVLDEPPCFVVVENVAPYDVIVLEVDEATLDAGRRLYRTALDTLAECRATDCWPGVSGGKRQSLVLPAWAVPTEDEVELTMGGEPMNF